AVVQTRSSSSASAIAAKLSRLERLESRICLVSCSRVTMKERYSFRECDPASRRAAQVSCSPGREFARNRLPGRERLSRSGGAGSRALGVRVGLRRGGRRGQQRGDPCRCHSEGEPDEQRREAVEDDEAVWSRQDSEERAGTGPATALG